MIWAAVAGAVVAVATLALAELAIVSVGRLRLRRWVREKIRGTEWADEEAVDGPLRLLAPILVGQTFTLTLAAALVARAVSGTGPVDAAGALRGAAWTCLVLVPPLYLLGETLPRALARARAHQLFPFVAAAVQRVGWLFRPLTAAAHMVSRGLLGSRRSAADPTEARRHLEALLQESERVGVVEPAEREIIAGVFEFGRTPVGAVMMPAERIVSAPPDATAGAITALIRRTGYSRIPIRDADGGDVRGMVHVFDLFKLDPDARPVPRAVVRFDPETPCDDALVEMKRQRRHLAVVTESGRVVGMVTMEDLVEELVGEIRDEHDARAEALDEPSDQEAFVVDGHTGLADIDDARDIAASGTAGTVADLVVGRFGRVPRPGETIAIDGWWIEVLDATPQRVRRVRFRRGAPPPPARSTD
ncbi:MAG TPA: CNNM domain-containing protein [Gemmatimonadota bacterium]|nr:CNNM domain-containing protein [Gemmatimonadota bacterium]